MPPVQRPRGAPWVLLAAVLLSGCIGARHRQRPEQVAESFARALQSGRPARAYKLLSPAQRERISEAEFASMFKQNRAESQELAELMDEPSKVQVQAQLTLADGRVLRLVQDRDGFRFDEPLLDFYDRSTPRAALLSFVRAVERRRWDALLTLLPRADAEGLTPELLKEHLTPQLEQLTRAAALLRTQENAPIEVVGDRATLPYSQGATLRFVRETDGWKVEDPE